MAGRRRGSWRTRMAASRINPRHGAIRTVLRATGPLLIVVGIAFFFEASRIDSNAPGFFEDTKGHSKAFDKAMSRRTLGGIFVVLGIGLTAFGWQGAIARFKAAETAPVAKDTINYVVDGTRKSIKTVASAVSEGMRESAEPEKVVRCHKCNKDNDVDAQFCDACGAPLTKDLSCPSCGELNDPDANFCDSCGTRLG